MKEFLIPCECGGGYMVLDFSTRVANYPVRYFYRCPLANVDCSSIWADELLLPKYSRLHPILIEVGMEADILPDDDMSVPTTIGCQPNIIRNAHSNKKVKSDASSTISSKTRSSGNAWNKIRPPPLPSEKNVTASNVLFSYCSAELVAFCISFVIVLICLEIMLL